jgi:hypothetical protein
MPDRSPALGELDAGPRVHKLRRCPKCGAVTERLGHCFLKGPPLIPQMDSDTPTEPCDVVILADVIQWFIDRADSSYDDGNWDASDAYRRTAAAVTLAFGGEPEC